MKKTACYRPFKNGHFARVCKEKIMDHQYKENGARSIYSNYNQMRACDECSPNQSKNLYLIGPFHRAIDETLKIPEKRWPFLYPNFTRVYCSSALPSHAYKIVITTVCIQRDNCFYNTRIIVLQCGSIQ